MIKKTYLSALMRLLPLASFIGILFFLGRGLSLDPHALPLAQTGEAIPYFTVPVLGQVSQLQSDSLRGSYTLLNVWASWCEACATEQAFLMKLSQSGIPIVGMNYKDKIQDAKKWLTVWGNPYQTIGVDASGQVGMSLGVYGTPETFLISAEGKLLYRHAGALTPEIWEKAFLPRMHGVG